MHDYTADIELPSVAGFKELDELAKILIARELEEFRCEVALKAAVEARREVAERRLPELMEKLGLSQFTTTSGIKVKVATSYYADIPEARKSEAHRWLERNGQGGLIKRNMEVSFGKGENEEAAAFKDLLAHTAFSDRLTEKEAVHPSTLRGWVREMLEAGKDVPMELFGVGRRQSVKIG